MISFTHPRWILPTLISYTPILMNFICHPMSYTPPMMRYYPPLDNLIPFPMHQNNTNRFKNVQFVIQHSKETMTCLLDTSINVSWTRLVVYLTRSLGLYNLAFIGYMLKRYVGVLISSPSIYHSLSR